MARPRESRDTRGISSIGRASGWQPEGQGFESPILHFTPAGPSMAPAGLARGLAFRASGQVVGGPPWPRQTWPEGSPSGRAVRWSVGPDGPGRPGPRARLPGERSGGRWPRWPRQAWPEGSPSGRAVRWSVATPLKPEARAEGMRPVSSESTRSPSARASGFQARANRQARSPPVFPMALKPEARAEGMRPASPETTPSDRGHGGGIRVPSHFATPSRRGRVDHVRETRAPR